MKITVAGVMLALATMTGSALAESDQFDADYGMRLLQTNHFDEASRYFESHLHGNAVAYYGLALTKFRRDTKNLTLNQAEEIVGLYEQAISLSPTFADAYFMCGMAYNAEAGFQLGGFNRHRELLSADGLAQADARIAKAEAYLQKAAALNPGFAKIAVGEIETSRRLATYSHKLKAQM